MGQYYKFIILADTKKNNKEVILLYINPHDYNHGAKLMEHSYMNTDLMNIVEYLISVHGNFYKSRIVWAGDYAEEELTDTDTDNDTGESMNLYRLTENYSSYTGMVSESFGKYIVNHTKKLYVDKDKDKNKENNIHPLPLLISEGNGNGGGDYHGNNEDLCGTWARDIISMENTIPENYTELDCNFGEYY